MLTIAYFVTSHGFGHAARTCAVIAALQRKQADIRFEIFTQTPHWFFRDSLDGPFFYHEIQSDVGFVQADPLHEDLDATIRALNHYMPFRSKMTTSLASMVSALGCDMVISDISPLGLHIAKKLGIPSILIENFTWDWIYENYETQGPDLKRHAAYLKAVFESADYHIQSRPACAAKPCDLSTEPVSRIPKTSRETIRKKLGISNRQPMVLISMGGVPMNYRFLDRLQEKSDICFVVPGAAETCPEADNLIPLGVHSPFFHPDLLNAADALVGKAGYSTLAEAYNIGVPFGYVSRGSFPESRKLASFIANRMPSRALTESGFETADWIHQIGRLLAMPNKAIGTVNGADQIADFLINLFSSQHKNVHI